MLNVWKMFPKGRYFLFHPINYIRDLFYPIKYAWQRCYRGYADMDLFNMDQYLIELLPKMLDDLADCAHGHPCSSSFGFSSHQEWKDYLKSISTHFKNANEDTCPEKNEYEQMFSYADVTETKHPDGTISIVSNAPEELRKNYWNRTVEINQYRERELSKALEMLSPAFFALWD